MIPEDEISDDLDEDNPFDGVVWHCDSIQFARLLAAIYESEEFSFKVLSREMGIPENYIDDIFDRAMLAWEGVKLDSRFFGPEVAADFYSELMGVVGSLENVAAEDGGKTLSCLMYLQQAILSGAYVDRDLASESVKKVIEKLPSGEYWMDFFINEEEMRKLPVPCPVLPVNRWACDRSGVPVRVETSSDVSRGVPYLM